MHVISWRTNKGFSFTLRDDGAVAPIGTFETPLSDGWGLAELDGDLYRHGRHGQVARHESTATRRG